MKPTTVGEWTIKKLRDHLGMDCHTSDHVLDVLVKEINAAKLNNLKCPTCGYQLVALNNDELTKLTEKAAYHELRSQLAAEERRANDSITENVRLMNRLAAEREESVKWRSEASKTNELRQQFAVEREKYQRSQEKVREYFDLLAAERAKWKGLE